MISRSDSRTTFFRAFMRKIITFSVGYWLSIEARLVGKLFTILMLAVTSALAGDTNTIPLLTIKGQSYTNVEIGTVTPSRVTLFYDGGGKQFPIADLPEYLQKQFHYDPIKAANEMEGVQQKKLAVALAQDKARKSAAVESNFDKYFTTKYDPIRQNGLHWNSRERLNPAGFIHVSFSAIILQNEVSFWTNALGVHYQASRKPQYVFMDIDRHYYSKLNDFIIVYGDKRKDFGSLNPIDTSTTEVVTESFLKEFPYSEFKEIAFANSVKAVLGASSFDLSYPDRAAMRALVNYFDYAIQGKNDTAST